MSMNAVASIACMSLMLSAGSAMAGPNNFDGVWKVHLVTNVSVAVRLLLQQSMSVHYMRTASLPIVLKANLRCA